jgi:hypothetical protein
VRVSAGPTLTLSQLHCAIVPDGPDNQWEGGEYQRIEARNRRALEAKLDSAANSCAVCGRDDDLVDREVDGRWVTTCREHARPAQLEEEAGVPSDWTPCSPASPIADDLTIPEFLRRGGGR